MSIIMDIKTYRTETIIIDSPTNGLLRMVDEMKEHKRKIREKMRTMKPMFTIKS